MRLILLFISLLPVVSFAQEADEWLARRGVAEVTVAELQRYLITVPDEHRSGVMASRKRVGEILNGLLLNEQMVNDAIAAGVENDPKVKVELERAKHRVLIQAWLEKVGVDGAKGDLEQIAYEDFLSKQENFVAPETVDVTHILISTRQRSEQEAQTIAEDLHARLTSGDIDFDAAVTEFSEDPSKSKNEGRFPAVRRGQMVKPFEEAAFAMEEVGSLSPIVKSQFGFHIIRLDGRTEAQPIAFEQVKNSLIIDAQNKLEADVRTQYQNELEAIMPEVNESAIQNIMQQYRPDELK